MAFILLVFFGLRDVISNSWLRMIAACILTIILAIIVPAIIAEIRSRR
ncbi:MAG: hypothetical protein PGN21_01225 [Sphingomonas paucimobilis]